MSGLRLVTTLFLIIMLLLPTGAALAVDAPKLTLSPASQEKTVGEFASFTAHLVDGLGEPISGEAVQLLLNGDPVGFPVNTDSSGNAQLQYTSNAVRTDAVTATASPGGDNVTSSSVNVEWLPSRTTSISPGDLVKISLVPTSSSNATGSTQTLTAIISDQAGSRVSGILVRFSVNGKNGPKFGSSVTDADGQATFSFTGSNEGDDTVTAYADRNENMAREDDVEPSAEAIISWVTNPVSSLSLSPTNARVFVGESQDITVTLLDKDENPVEDVLVWVQVTGVDFAFEHGATTTSEGTPVPLAYNGDKPGEHRVAAYADINRNEKREDWEPSATGKITWISVSNSSSSFPSAQFGPAEPAPVNSKCTFYSETRHNLCGGFRDYWNTFGGLAVYGFPITEEFRENGVITQYFERARFEWYAGSWPERFDVQLGLVGKTVTTGRVVEAPFQPAGANGSCTYYRETSHNLCGGFRDYWNNFGGLAVYGFPISEEFEELNPDDGQIYTVQYFERGRFEWHPGAWPERSDVMLGRLGAQVLQSKYGVVR